MAGPPGNPETWWRIAIARAQRIVRVRGFA
jgi:hypothetical protein